LLLERRDRSSALAVLGIVHNDTVTPNRVISSAHGAPPL
jgi:hypothetical protein